MNWQWVNVVFCLSATAISVFLGIYAWQRPNVLGSRWFSTMVLAAGWIAFWYVFQSLAGNDLAAYLTFSKFEYIGLTFISMLWFGFALTFGGHGYLLTRRWIALLALIPVITIVLAWTNEWHGLIWAEPRFTYVSMPPLYTPSYGSWFWIYVIYSYTAFFVGTVVLILVALRSWRLYRLQSSLILFATGIPWVGNLIEIIDITPFPGLYMQALFLTICNILLGFAVFRLRLLDIMPLAHNLILQNIPDGVIVVDTQDRIVALNAMMTRYIHTPNAVGKPLAEVFSAFASVVEALKPIEDGKLDRKIGDQHIQIRVTPLHDHRNQVRGRLFILNDISARVRADQIQYEQQIFTETIRQITNQLNSTLDLERVLSLIVESAKVVLPNDRTDMILLKADGETAHVWQHTGIIAADMLVLAGLSFKYRDFPLLATAADQGIVIVPDTRQEARWLQVPALTEIRAIAIAPIYVKGKIGGFISLNSFTPDRFDQRIGDRLQIFAVQAGIALQNAQLYEQVKHQADELNRRVDALTITQAVYDEIKPALKVQNLIDLALDAMVRLSGADGGFIALLDSGQLKLIQHFGLYDKKMLEQDLLASQSGLTRALSERRPMLIQDDPLLTSAMPGARAQIQLPMTKSDQELIGIAVVETRSPTRFTPDRFQLMGLLLDRVISALENARLIEAIEANANQLQALYQHVSHLERLKSDMIRIAAHDLRNPIGVIRGYTQILLMEQEGGEYQHFYEAIERASKRMLQIVEDILSLERIERIGTMVQDPLPLPTLTEEIIGEFLLLATQKNQQIETHFEAYNCQVKGDVAQIRQVITNFISNAIKYTPEGGQIRVKLTCEENLVKWQIHDTGYGIPKDLQKRLFEPFYRVNTRETRQIEGTGLGLYLVKNIIERHHGAILFESVYGQGSMFGFALPCE
ncbi:MAG: ATP-binding protein [Anaerolineae bacterium]|jgi:signal transduction histidine kinase/PAS domain-containing protein|nr:ATP-binding protein [Anaerolineae bacterium]